MNLLLELFQNLTNFFITVMNQGTSAFLSVSIIEKVSFVLIAIIPYINPVRLKGQSAKVVKVFQTVVSILMIVALVRFSANNWSLLMNPILLAPFTFIMTINNRVDDVVKAQIKQIKKSFAVILQPTFMTNPLIRTNECTVVKAD